MLVFGFEADHLAEWLKELVSRVDNELKVEFFDDICLFLKDLRNRVLPSTARNKLLRLRNLISLLKLSCNVHCSHTNELQLIERHILDSEVLVDQRSNGEDGLREHLVLVVEFADPVQ